MVCGDKNITLRDRNKTAVSVKGQFGEVRNGFVDYAGCSFCVERANVQLFGAAGLYEARCRACFVPHADAPTVHEG